MTEGVSIGQLEYTIVGSSSAATKNIDSLVSSLNKLKTATGGGIPGLSSVATQMNNLGSASGSVDKVVSSNKRLVDSFRGLLDVTRVIAAYYTTRRVINAIMSPFNVSSDYIEAINLATITMREFSEESVKYAESVEKLIGINQTDWLTNLGSFNQMFLGFGATSEQAAKMSQNLTQLGYDIQSAFNASDLSAVMGRLQSGIAGQVKGMREYGVELTVAAMEEYALSKGIQQSFRSMTQLEKAQLRYMKIMETTRNLQGDLARTIETPSNALRILSAQWEVTKRHIGDIISLLVTKAIPYIQAFVKYLGEAAQKLADMWGFELTEIDYSGLDAITGAAEEGEEAVKKLKKSLMSFDELERLNGNGGSDTLTSVLDGFNLDDYSYDFLENIDTSKADELLEKLRGKFDGILTLVLNIGAGMLAWKAGSGVTSLFSLVSGGLGLQNGVFDTVAYQTSMAAFFNKIKVPLGLTLSVAGVAVAWDGAYNAGKFGLDVENGLKMLLGSGLIVGGMTIAFGAAGFVVGLGLAAVVSLIGVKMGQNAALEQQAIDFANSTETSRALADLKAQAEAQIEATLEIRTRLQLKTDELADVKQTFDDARTLIDSIYALAEKSDKTPGDIAILNTLVKEVNNLGLGDIITEYNDLTGAVNDSRYAVELLIEQMQKQQEIEIYSALYKETLIAQARAESSLPYAQLQVDAGKEFLQKSVDQFQDIIDSSLSLSFTWDNLMFENGNDFDIALSKLEEKLSGLSGIIFSDKERVEVKAAIQQIQNAYEAVGEAQKNLVIQNKTLEDAAYYLDVYKQKIEELTGEKHEIDIKLDEYNAQVFENRTHELCDIPDIVIGMDIQLTDNSKSVLGVLGRLNPNAAVGMSAYASGGFPATGEIFLAREAGPEYVGTMGGHTAVANNDDIQAGIASGVANALSAFVPSIISAIRENKDVYFSDEQVARAANRGNNKITARVVG